jgi:tripartite-type tricarboxylate transporter receptor subunit TctC
MSAIHTPSLPSRKQTCVPGWHGLNARANTPSEVQECLSAALRFALRDERVRQCFAELVTEPVTEDRATPAYHRRFLA